MLKDGKIALRETDRLSKPAVMNKNFEEAVRADLKRKNPLLTNLQIEALIKAEKNRVQIHHLIPDEVVQTTELGKAAQKAGYNLDEGNNLKGMPRTEGDRINEFDTEHRGSHPKYSGLVTEEMNKTAKKIRDKYNLKSLENLPKDQEKMIQKEIRLEMKRIEKQFRRKIERNDPSIILNNGKLAMIPLQMRGNGNYEIRA